MGEPRDHHFIPKFFLKSWCDKNGQLIEYTKKNGKLIAKPVGPGGTGFQRDAYAFPDLPPEQAQILERDYFDFHDREASLALQELLTVGVPSNNERQSAMTRFVVGLHLRHPDGIPELRDAAKAIWNGTAEKSEARYQAIRKPNDPATLDEYIAAHDPHFPAKAALGLVVTACFENPRLLERVHAMAWRVFDTSPSHWKLLLSDRPVGLVTIGKPDGHLWLPISPTKLIVAAPDPRTLDFFGTKKPKELVSMANYATVSRARRFVWAADRSQELFIESHFGTALDPLPLFPNAGRLPGER